ncbi:ACP S-malonyltransferase [candidate division WOR-3 bacterium]|nr:ACP S-malonyltransferase [candidate division WOR-3 bacterium]
MKDVIFLFDGQGAFRAGIGKDLCGKYPTAKEIVDKSSSVLGYDLSEHLWGDKAAETASKTSIAQPAISTISLAYAEVLRDLDSESAVSLGHSLGEITAIVYCGVVSFDDGIRMIQKRGEVMEAGGKQGTMMAVLNVDLDVLEELCSGASKEISEPVVVANINAPNQIVISGSKQGVARIAQHVAQKGGRGIPLKVGGAWHSPYLEGAAKEYAEFLDAIEFKKPARQFYSVVEQRIMQDPAAIKDSIKRQMLSRVNWLEAIRNIKDTGYTKFLEVGPSKILRDLTGKIDQQIGTDSTALYTELNKLVDAFVMS